MFTPHDLFIVQVQHPASTFGGLQVGFTVMLSPTPVTPLLCRRPYQLTTSHETTSGFVTDVTLNLVGQYDTTCTGSCPLPCTNLPRHNVLAADVASDATLRFTVPASANTNVSLFQVTIIRDGDPPRFTALRSVAILSLACILVLRGRGVTETATRPKAGRIAAGAARGFRGAWRLAPLVVWAAAPACDLNSKPCLGLAKGDQVTVSFIEPFDINSRFKGAPGSNPLTCNDAIGFSSGQTFAATLTSFMGNHGCFSGVSDGFTVGGWTWQRDPNLNGVSGGDVLEGLYLGTLGMCTGRLSLSVHTDKLPTTPPVPGQPPTATAAFSFSATGDAIGDLACPHSCGGTMVATVSSP